METTLFYPKEALFFEEALPIGNGRVGAMVYGGTERERLSLNADTIWSGCGKKNPAPKNAAAAYEKAKKLVQNNQIAEAQELLSKDFFGMWSQMYLPLGNLFITFNHKNVLNYSRRLHLDTGICETVYTCGGIQYKREAFASFPDQILVLRLTSDKKDGFTVETETPLKTEEKFLNRNILTLHGRCPSNGCSYSFVQEEPLIYTEEKGIGFTCAVKIETDGDCKETPLGAVSVTNASETILYICIQTSFNGHDKSPDAAYKEPAQNALKPFTLAAYTSIKQKHMQDFSGLFNRVQFSLNGKAPETDTETRLRNFNGRDLGLYELLFAYGRYLTISASREGTQATNLQGIWNENLNPPWSSNYTLNINTQMNYWPTLNTNLGECFEPFVHLAEVLHQTGQETARDYYGARGFVSHHNTDLWGMSNPVGFKRSAGACTYAFWNMSSGWICCQLYELYLYTLNEQHLKRIYPILQDAVLFYTDLLEQDKNGYYKLIPSTSPENEYIKNGERYSVSETTAMTMCILNELFTRFLEASKTLHTENELTQKAAEILPKLYPLQIAKDGRICEWAKEEQEADKNHRHVSHLYGLYPGNSVSLEKTPALAKAFKQSLITRGDDGTGWSLAWKMNLWAYLKDGNHALQLLQNQLRFIEPPKDAACRYCGGGTYPNLFDAHPPFQIDGNFGAAAAICNMLLQSEVGYIELLPALPDSWYTGHISGIVAKGGIEISMKWARGIVTYLTFKTSHAQNVLVSVNGKKIHVQLTKNKIYTIL